MGGSAPVCTICGTPYEPATLGATSWTPDRHDPSSIVGSSSRSSAATSDVLDPGDEQARREAEEADAFWGIPRRPRLPELGQSPAAPTGTAVQLPLPGLPEPEPTPVGGVHHLPPPYRAPGVPAPTGSSAVPPVVPPTAPLVATPTTSETPSAWGPPRPESSTWGTTGRTPPSGSGFTVTPLRRHRVDRRWVRRLVALGVVVALGVWVWVDRDTFIGLVRDTPDATDTGADTPSDSPTDTEPAVDTEVQGRVQTPTSTVAAPTTGDAAFISWEQEHLAELDDRVQRVTSTSDRWAQAFAAGTSPGRLAEATATMTADLRALVDLLNTAPDAPARTDALRYLLLTFTSVQELTAYVETGERARFDAGLSLARDAVDDFQRSVDRHQGRVWFFRG